MADESFRVIVPASTSNLGSGFDTLSAALALFLEVQVQASPGRKTVISHPSGFAPETDVLKLAFERACSHLDVSPDGWTLTSHNPIPLQRGLGSSGAAIVAGIKIAEKVSGQQLSPREILEIGLPLEGHPENLAASLVGGWILSRTDGDRVDFERLDVKLNCTFLVAVPDIRISTAEARAILPHDYPLADVVFSLQRAALFVYALRHGRAELIREALRDKLHQPYRAKLIGGSADLLAYSDLPRELEQHLLGVAISGSGSALLALVRDQSVSIQKWMRSVLERAGTKCRFLSLDLETQGARIE